MVVTDRGARRREKLGSDLELIKWNLKCVHEKAMSWYPGQPYLSNRLRMLVSAIGTVQGILATADRERTKDEKRNEKRKEKLARGRKRR